MVRCGSRSGDEFPLAACPRQPRHRWSRLRLEEQVRRGKDSSAAGSGWSCCFKRANELPKVTESWSVSQISDNSVTCPNTTPDTSKGQNAQTQNVRVWRKGKFIDREGADREDGRPKPHMHFKKVQSSSFFCVKGRKMGGAVSVKSQAPSRIPLQSSMSVCKTEQDPFACRARERCRLGQDGASKPGHSALLGFHSMATRSLSLSKLGC